MGIWLLAIPDIGVPSAAWPLASSRSRAGARASGGRPRRRAGRGRGRPRRGASADAPATSRPREKVNGRPAGRAVRASGLEEDA
ncbi:MAG: hypothetical protein MZU95_05315 [Desulfomicrobium escambiense]|nr:hypothetical protein [Desulfomicrobium escambiense]